MFSALSLAKGINLQNFPGNIKYILIFLLSMNNSIELVLLFIRNELDVSADKKADDHGAGKKGMRKYCSKLVLV